MYTRSQATCTIVFKKNYRFLVNDDYEYLIDDIKCNIRIEIHILVCTW